MFLQNSWPVLSPEPYAGVDEEPVTKAEVSGKWEMLFPTDNNDQKISTEILLKIEDEFLNDGILHTCWDFENNKINIIISGITNLGIAYWGKRMQ